MLTIYQKEYLGPRYIVTTEYDQRNIEKLLESLRVHLLILRIRQFTDH